MITKIFSEMITKVGKLKGTLFAKLFHINRDFLRLVNPVFYQKVREIYVRPLGKKATEGICHF